MMTKIYKCSTKSEAAIHGCTVKNCSEEFKIFAGKTPCMSFFLNKVVCLHPEIILKKRLL